MSRVEDWIPLGTRVSFQIRDEDQEGIVVGYDVGNNNSSNTVHIIAHDDGSIRPCTNIGAYRGIRIVRQSSLEEMLTHESVYVRVLAKSIEAYKGV